MGCTCFRTCTSARAPLLYFPLSLRPCCTAFLSVVLSSSLSPWVATRHEQHFSAFLTFSSEESCIFSKSCMYLKHHLLLCQHRVRTKKRKRKKWCFLQAKTPSNQNLVSHPAFLTTKCGFFREHDLWHSEEKCFAGEQMSLLRCCSTAFQCRQDGSILEAHKEI